MDSDQKTLQHGSHWTDTLARGARTRITSIQAYGIAASTLTYMIQMMQVHQEQQ